MHVPVPLHNLEHFQSPSRMRPSMTFDLDWNRPWRCQCGFDTQNGLTWKDSLVAVGALVCGT